VLPVPDSEHNEALDGDTLFNVSFNFQWRRLIVQELSTSMFRIAATIDDDSEREIFENRVGVMLQDFYDEEIVPATVKEATRTITQSITANNDTSVVWNSGDHEGGINSNRVSFSFTGLAIITASLNLTSAIACQANAWLRINGVDFGRDDSDAQRQSHWFNPVFALNVPSGQYVELMVRTTQAATLAIATSTPKISVSMIPVG
jgi:hypothetical protein